MKEKFEKKLSLDRTEMLKEIEFLKQDATRVKDEYVK